MNHFLSKYIKLEYNFKTFISDACFGGSTRLSRRGAGRRTGDAGVGSIGTGWMVRMTGIKEVRQGREKEATQSTGMISG